ncbi:MAG: hypothetical protein HQL62_06905, partial [Magnetococcales bacterium]|nr:hypothetical protein [Magnetococcales bacterium]
SDLKAQQWRQQTWPRLLDALKKAHRNQSIDLFLGYLYPRHIDVQAIREIQAMGIPCVNFFCDNVREFKKIPDE